MFVMKILSLFFNWKVIMIKQKRTSIPQAHVDNLYKRITGLKRELYVREVYIKHALDNSKESLIERIVTLEQAHTDRVVRIEALEKECDGKDRRITELERDYEPLALYDFIDSYEGLTMMQLWDWLMYNGYTKRVKE